MTLWLLSSYSFFQLLFRITTICTNFQATVGFCLFLRILAFASKTIKNNYIIYIHILNYIFQYHSAPLLNFGFTGFCLFLLLLRHCSAYSLFFVFIHLSNSFLYLFLFTKLSSLHALLFFFLFHNCIQVSSPIISQV